MDNICKINVQSFWEKQDFKVGMGSGLFKHEDITE